MDCSTTGLPVHHRLLEFTKTYVHWVGDAIQPSHLCRPLLFLPSVFPSIRVFFPVSRFFFASGGQGIGASASTSALPMNIQCWFPFRLTGLISLLSKGHLKVFSSTAVRKHQFFSAQPSLWFFGNAGLLTRKVEFLLGGLTCLSLAFFFFLIHLFNWSIVDVRTFLSLGVQS